MEAKGLYKKTYVFLFVVNKTQKKPKDDIEREKVERKETEKSVSSREGLLKEPERRRYN